MTDTFEELQQEPSWLLLLTTAPSHLSFASLKATYGIALLRSLEAVSAASKATGKVKRLDIAVPYSRKGHAVGNPQSSYFPVCERVLGQMYTLVGSFCTELSIDNDYDNDVDARIILIDTTDDGLVCGVSLRSLAAYNRPWKHLYSVDCLDGEVFLNEFLQTRHIYNPSWALDLEVQKIDTGASIPWPEHIEPDEEPAKRCNAKPHYSVAVGGTFDHLHIGHKLLLTMTALVLEFDHKKTRTLTVGITGDALLKKNQYIEVLQDWNQRQASVRDFLLSILDWHAPSDPTGRTYDQKTNARSVRDDLSSGLTINYVEIFDAFGPTITDEKISALVISGETRSGGKAVNDRREEKGWAPLEVFEVDVLDAHDEKGSGSAKADFQNKISSTEIRRRLHLRHARSATTSD